MTNCLAKSRKNLIWFKIYLKSIVKARSPLMKILFANCTLKFKMPLMNRGSTEKTKLFACVRTSLSLATWVLNSNLPTIRCSSAWLCRKLWESLLASLEVSRSLLSIANLSKSSSQLLALSQLFKMRIRSLTCKIMMRKWNWKSCTKRATTTWLQVSSNFWFIWKSKNKNLLSLSALLEMI